MTAGQFEAVMDEMFVIVYGLHKSKERLTVVIDKGMNTEGDAALSFCAGRYVSKIIPGRESPLFQRTSSNPLPS